MNVSIIYRDVNGETGTLYSKWSMMPELLEHMSVELEESEILAVMADDCCLYSQLMAAEPITWQDLSGFFA